MDNKLIIINVISTTKIYTFVSHISAYLSLNIHTCKTELLSVSHVYEIHFIERTLWTLNFYPYCIFPSKN